MVSSAPSRTKLGPLTSVFTPPPTCTRLIAYPGNLDQAWFAQYCTSGYVANDPACWPPPAATGTSVSTLTSGYFSPGLFCPSGYTSACVQSNVLSTPTSARASLSLSQFSFEYPPGYGETAIGCCPTYYSFTCAAGGGQTCITSATNTIIDAFDCGVSGGTNSYTLTIPTSVGSSTALTRTIYAPLIQLVHKEADRTTLVTTVTATATSKATSGLSKGDDAAIGVGVIAVILFIAVFFLSAMLLRRRRMRTKLIEKASKEQTTIGSHQPSANTAPMLNELDGNATYELPSKASRSYE